MGRGQADALSGDGKAISDLLVAPVPSLQSQLLPESAFSTLPSSSTTAGQASSTQQCPIGQLQGTQQPTAVGQWPTHLAAGAGAAQAALHSMHSGAQTQSASAQQHALAGQHPSQIRNEAGTQLGAAQGPCCWSEQAAMTVPLQQMLSKTRPQLDPTQPGIAYGPGCWPEQAAMTVPLQQMLSITQPQPDATQHGTAHGSQRLPEDAAATLPLQRMLLEAVANKSIQSLQDINRLASSTLLAHQAQSCRVQLAIRSALVVLR